MPQGRASKPLGALALLLAGPALAGADGGDAMIARARAAESAQLRVLSRAPGGAAHERAFRRREDDAHVRELPARPVPQRRHRVEHLRERPGRRQAGQGGGAAQGDGRQGTGEGAGRRAHLGAGAAELSGHGGDRGRPDAAGRLHPALSGEARRDGQRRHPAGRREDGAQAHRRNRDGGRAGLAGRSPGERVDVRRGRLAGRVPFELPLQAGLDRTQRRGPLRARSPAAALK